MSWLLVIVSTIVVWVASLFKILNSSRSQSNAAFLTTGKIIPICVSSVFGNFCGCF